MLFQPQTQPAFNAQPPNNPPLQQQTLNLDGKHIPPYCVDQLKQIIDFTSQLQWDCNLQNLITLLRYMHERSIETMEKATSEEAQNRDKDPRTSKEHLDYVRERCSKIKKRNQELLTRMLNLREKMVNQMYMYKSRSTAKELEISQINEKIRNYKCQISLKYNYLRGLRLNR